MKTNYYRMTMVAGLLLCCGGCAEFRQDTAHFGGYYLTSCVEHVGHRELKLQRIYLTPDYVIAEANLTRPTRRSSEIIGKRFLVADRNYIDGLLTSTKANLFQGKAQIRTEPLNDWQPLRTQASPQGWMMWPDTLGKTDREMSIDDLLRLLSPVADGKVQYPSETVPVEIHGTNVVAYFYYPQHVDTAAFWQEREYLVAHPVMTTMFKIVVVPPAMIVDTACLPVVGCVFIFRMISYSHGHGP